MTEQSKPSLALRAAQAQHLAEDCHRSIRDGHMVGRAATEPDLSADDMTDLAREHERLSDSY